MAENNESGVQSARDAALESAISAGIGYYAPEFKTISAAKTKKKRAKKLRKIVTKSNKNKDLCIDTLFMTDG